MRTWALLCALMIPSISLAQMDLLRGPQPRPSSNAPLSEPGIGDTTSVDSLKYENDSKVMKELHKARAAYRRAEFQAAIEHVEKVIEMAPAFAAAHNDLGVYYTHLNEREKALREFRKAVTFDPTVIQMHLNLAAMLVVLGHGVDAEEECRRVLQLDSKSQGGNYLLALSLILQDKYTPEALSSLKKAGPEFVGSSGLTKQLQAQLQRASD